MNNFQNIHLVNAVQFFKNGTTAKQVSYKTSKAVTRIESISNENLDNKKLGYVSENEELEKYRLISGDILFSNINSVKHIGKTAKVEEVGELFNGMNLLQIRPNKKVVDPTFLHELLRSEEFRQIIRRNSKQAVNQASISIRQLQQIPITIPPLPEQKKIAEILSSIDNLIKLKEQKINKIEQLKKSIFEDLTSLGINNNRFKESPCGKIPIEWNVKKIGDVFSDIKDYPEMNDQSNLFSLTIEFGLIPKPERYIRDFLINDKSKDNYKLVKHGDLVMNPMNLRWGAIASNHIDSNLTVSKYYNVLRLKNNAYSFIFFENLFKSQKYLNIYESIATGTLVEKKRVHWSDFKNLSIPIPTIKDQQKINQILKNYESIIRQLVNNLSTLKNLKKSLSNDLLTGRSRVSV